MNFITTNFGASAAIPIPKGGSFAYQDADVGLGVIASTGDDIVGFMASAVLADGVAEISGPGGGALAIAAGNISDGDRLKVNADGHLVVASSAGDFSVAVARADAVDNDVFPVYVEALRIHA